MIDTNTVVSISEVNRDFSKISRIVDEYGSAVIVKDDTTGYLVIQINYRDPVSNAPVADALASAEKIMDQFDDALKVLAK